MYVSTNGYISFGEGFGDSVTTPQDLIGIVGGNCGDLLLEPGVVMDDGDTQNLYYATGGINNKSYVKFIAYTGTFGDDLTSTSWLLNFYLDFAYQWVETRVKSNPEGRVGPYNDPTDVSRPSATTSRVWRGDLLGENWVYMGNGSIN